MKKNIWRFFKIKLFCVIDNIENRNDLVAAVIRILNGLFMSLHQKLVCIITPETTTGYNSEGITNKILTIVSRHLLTH